ncbi:MAG: PEP-CTERM sorting domain-containing protein [Sedimenticola sp.]|nr:PEP-CTERM sorting domain-containing protein [Sedimenticola sp.]
MKKSNITKALILFFALISSSQFVQAVAISDTSASLTLDWESLDSLVIWNDGNFKYNGADANLDGVTDSNYQSEDGWTGSPVLSYQAQVTADATGNAGTTMTSANVSAHARADGIGTTTPPDEDASASGTSHRGKTFSPISDGEITFSFDYLISHALSNDNISEGNAVYSHIALNLMLGTVNIGSDLFTSGNVGEITGAVGFTVDLLAANTYYLEGHVYSSASASSPQQTAESIPEPATVALLVIGLAGLGYRRLHSNNGHSSILS